MKKTIVLETNVYLNIRGKAVHLRTMSSTGRFSAKKGEKSPASSQEGLLPPPLFGLTSSISAGWFFLFSSTSQLHSLICNFRRLLLIPIFSPVHCTTSKQHLCSSNAVLCPSSLVSPTRLFDVKLTL